MDQGGEGGMGSVHPKVWEVKAYNWAATEVRIRHVGRRTRKTVPAFSQKNVSLTQVRGNASVAERKRRRGSRGTPPMVLTSPTLL